MSKTKGAKARAKKGTMASRRLSASRRAGKEKAALYRYAAFIVKAALAEDIGGGDITTDAIVAKSRRSLCELKAKEDMVLAGLFVAEMAFKELDKRAVFKSGFEDGDTVRKGRVIATVTGRLAPLLTAERVALNFLQRLSGIATLTLAFVKKVEKTSVKILDTRKTTPCLRALERYAVASGGGQNHRSGLYDFVLIKDNHIQAAGGVAAAVKLVDGLYHGSVPIEVEASTLAEVRASVEAGADIIMLDNMGTGKIRSAVKIVGNRALLEVSGGVTLANVGAIAALGVDLISVGALTHSARAVDISMRVLPDARKGR
jgi:nicotinate-nucleotide pyrophosphorylase (carboxylating)